MFVVVIFVVVVFHSFHFTTSYCSTVPPFMCCRCLKWALQSRYSNRKTVSMQTSVYKLIWMNKCNTIFFYNNFCCCSCLTLLVSLYLVHVYFSIGDTIPYTVNHFLCVSMYLWVWMCLYTLQLGNDWIAT